MVGPDEERERHPRETRRKAERERFRRALPINVDELEELVTSVRDSLLEHGCNHTTRFAQGWAADRSIRWPPLESALNDQGGYCDCEIVYNCDPRHVFG